MHVVIAANHSHPHIGGTEKVIQQIGRCIVENGHKCTILSRSVGNQRLEHQGVRIAQCSPTFALFFKQIQSMKADYLFIYSDSFKYWPDILDASFTMPCRVGIALVGMNNMGKNLNKVKRLVDNQDHFDVITHSNNYKDYVLCSERGLTPIVIPNGVDLDEFEYPIDFRSKYKIKTPRLIVCVSNYFPGKGQEYLAKVIERLAGRRYDFTLAMVFSGVNFPYASRLERDNKRAMEKLKCPVRFLKDIPREDVIGAFCSADVFAFPSQKEVAPIVVMEAMAARTPWIAMPVGNVPQLSGGFMIPYPAMGEYGCSYDETSYATFVDHLDRLLNDEDERNQLGEAGRKQIEEEYDWEKLGQKYVDLFSRVNNEQSSI